LIIPRPHHSCTHCKGEEGNSPSVAGSPDDFVKTFPPPAKVPAFQALAQVYGQSSPALLAKYDPGTHLLKTPQRLLFEDSQESLQTLPPWGWMHAGAVWGLMTSGPGMNGNGRGFLPTAVRQDAQGHGRTTPDKPTATHHTGASLVDAIRQRYPTPSATSYGSNQGGAAGRVGPIRYSLESLARQGKLNLPTPSASMQTMGDLIQAQYAGDSPHRPAYADANHLPTPDASDWKQDGLEASKRRLTKWSTMSLNARVRLQTLSVADAMGGHLSRGGKRSGELLLKGQVKAAYATPTAHPRTSTPRQVDHGVQLANQAGGSLNPTWEEWYMGWPMSWTEAPGMSQTLLTPTAFLRWLSAYRSALNGLWRWVTDRSRSAPHWPGEY
jgi:hypothetical protein